MKTRIFKSFDEYEAWTEQFEDASDYMYIPTAVDNGRKVSVDMFTECKSWKTALRRFAKAFEKVNEEIPGWIESMKEGCESGYFADKFCEDKNNAFSYGIEELDDDCWYIYLNISGVYAGV